MHERLAKFRKLPAIARDAIDALGASLLVRVIGAVERAVKYRQGLLQRLENQRGAALAAAGDAPAGNSPSMAFGTDSAGGSAFTGVGLSNDPTAYVIGSPVRDGDNAEGAAAISNFPPAPLLKSA
jgi:hypothetical protein